MRIDFLTFPNFYFKIQFRIHKNLGMRIDFFDVDVNIDV